MAIGAEDNHPRRRVSVLGTEISFVDAGEGVPIVFLHGRPRNAERCRSDRSSTLGKRSGQATLTDFEASQRTRDQRLSFQNYHAVCVVNLDAVRGSRRLFLHGAVTREIPAGSHRLFTHNTLMWKTPLFAIVPGEHVAFQVINQAASVRTGCSRCREQGLFICRSSGRIDGGGG